MGEEGKQVSLLLHMYQPPWQYKPVLDKIVDECYSWLTELLAGSDSFHVDLNLNYSVVELLLDHGHDRVIENIGRGIENGNVEVTGSAAYHAFLPLVPIEEMRRQIAINHERNAEVFRGVWHPKGFFPPELGISNELVHVVKDFGYEWILTEDKVFEDQNDEAIPQRYIAELEGMPIIFRSSLWSNEFSMHRPDRGETNSSWFINDLERGMHKDSYLALAFDIETIGHHQKGYSLDEMIRFRDALEESGMQLNHLSDIVDGFKEHRPIYGSYKGSWSSTKEGIRDGEPYPLWQGKDNHLHALQWAFARQVADLVGTAKGDQQYMQARELLDKGLNSCQFWWADPSRWASPDYVLDAGRPLYEALDALTIDAPVAIAKAKATYGQLVEQVRAYGNDR